MLSFLHILLVILSIIIIGLVMLQSKGTGLSITPGTGDFGKFERRGAELTLHRATIALITLFIAASTLVYFIA